jgi:ribosomal protein S18 acetylase RimI-like enzyme
MLNRITKRHIALLSLLSILAGVGIFYLRSDQQQNSPVLRAYDADKDFRPLVKLINDNKFWVSERPDLSPEKVLTLRAPSNDPERAGQVTIDVVEADGQTAGFIAYYKKSFEHGFIWLLAVDKEFRGRGFGELLVTKAFSSFRQQNLKYVTLAARSINKPAISLYKKMGFVEQTRDDERGVITMIRRNL